ncbi:hypothetical protein M3Y97_00747900 [Aphelenchoides bicaudatus]|nr:hypothetical protein M3Y97_00747900 [Aphelenchoides bicaudatus]
MYFLSFALLFLKWPDIKAADSVQLMSTNDNFMSVISGFTVRLQCSVYRCNEEKPTVAWYKDELLIFNGSDFQLTSGIDPSNILLQLTAAPEQGQKCATDEYTLLLRNITLRDAGKYRCELHRRLQQLDFQIDVLENGLKPGFNKNIDFDVTACCIEQGISPLCRPMCKPKEMDLEFFDPTSCKTKDFKGFLYCATNGGKTDFIPCCKQKSVPSFCFDFCSFNFSMLKRSHRLCLYYLPELLQCFSQKQSRPPKAPSNLQIRRARHKLLCWKEVDSEDSPIEYSVHVREVPATFNSGR